MNIFTILIMMTVSQVNAYVKIYSTEQFKYVQFINKAVFV